jgi:alpha-tubulin suppressor-like RCC1 family protein
VQVATGVAQISAGAAHGVYVKSDGALWAMGANNYGQLGDGTTVTRPTPVQIATGVRQASAGGYTDGDNYGHTVFVKTDDTLWATGRNNHGQLGNGLTTNSVMPIQVATGVTKAYGGALHTVFLKTDNTVWSMGYNGYGQLGDNTTVDRGTPAQFDVNATAITAGGYHTLIITLP